MLLFKMAIQLFGVFRLRMQKKLLIRLLSWVLAASIGHFEAALSKRLFDSLWMGSITEAIMTKTPLICVPAFGG